MPRATLLPWLLALAILAQVGQAPAQESRPPPPSIRGMGLTLHSKDWEFDYGPFVAELPSLGVTHVCLFVHFYQPSGRSPAPARHPAKTPPDEVILRVMQQAREAGLEVGLLPIVLLERAAKDEWRGNLTPPDRQGRVRGDEGFAEPNWDRWFAGYARAILHFARLAQEGGASLFSVGSELSSTEQCRTNWTALIRRVRGIFAGELTYSANWDHYQRVPFWSQLDFIGLSGYYELTRSETPQLSELRASWQQVRGRLLAWRANRQLERLPLLFLEVGYPSQKGCARHPWDYTLDRPVDLHEQALCYRAFADTWRGCPALAGVYFYEWWGFGGPQDKGYTPRDKPALEVLEAFFRE